MSNKHKRSLAFDYTIRIASLVLSLSLCTMYLFHYSAQAHALELRTNSIVKEDTLRLSHLFEGIAYSDDSVLGAAPLPGQTMTLNVRTLMRVARAYGLDWKPAHVREAVVINRAAAAVDKSIIDHVITSSINEKRGNGDFRVNYSSPLPFIYISPEKAPTAEVIHINYSEGQNWFEATVASPSAADPEKMIKVYGTVENIVEVPVLGRAVQAGDVIRSGDITWMDYPTNRLNPNQIVDAEQLIGMSPRHLIKPNDIVLANQIQKPQMIKRGEKITILYENGPLTLRATGKALEAGSEGDFIRVVNNTSSRTIEVRVEDFKLAKAAF